MKVPLIDLQILFKSQEVQIRRALDEVLDSQHFINGPQVATFERDVEQFLEVEGVHAVGCSNGSVALLLAMMALDIGPGDEVIVPTYSFFSTASCVTLVGATPVWVDVEPETCNIDPRQIADKLTDRTRAIIPVHLFGRAADLDAIDAVLEAAGRRDQVVVVEDSAQALSARYRGQRVCTRGQLSCLSFFPTKNLGAYGDAGMVIGTDEALAHKVRVLSRHGAEVKYQHLMVGLNSRIDTLQAAILSVKLPLLDAWSEARRQNAARYRVMLQDAGVVRPDRLALPADDGPQGTYHHVYNQFNLQAADRDALREHLKEAGVGTAIYYPCPLPLQRCFERFGARPGQYPVAERAAAASLAIPVYPGIHEAQQAHVVQSIKSFYEART